MTLRRQKYSFCHFGSGSVYPKAIFENIFMSKGQILVLTKVQSKILQLFVATFDISCLT